MNSCLSPFEQQVKLQISPPTLTYTRELCASTDVFMQFVPRSTGLEVIQERGHVFLLTDLLLMCERMLPHEMAERGSADMWLLYPPLAGKHLRVEPVDGSGRVTSSGFPTKLSNKYAI